jgi:hypothetical protein
MARARRGMFEARLEDRLEIQDVIYLWCRAIDRLDLELVEIEIKLGSGAVD